MKYLVSLVFLLNFISCAGGGDLNNTTGISPGGGVADTNPPSLSGSITIATNNEAFDRSPTLTWTAATDEEGLVASYQISIGADNSSGTCEAADFTSPLVNSITVPSSADFTGAGYQLVNGVNDGNANPISLSQLADTNYCLRLTASDDSGNVSTPIYSSVYQYTFADCNAILNAFPMSTDGVYTIDPDQDGGDASYGVFCDMTTDGGGWTLAIRYDRSQAIAGAYALAANSGRQLINVNEMDSINAEASLSASINMIPIISNGATHLMHVGKANDAASDSTTYVRVYFSEIYQAVLDTPSNIFNPTLDTNSGDGVAGATGVWTPAARNRWFESDFSEMVATDTDGSFFNTMIIGGEGNGMFTNGDREGAVYSSGTSGGGVTGHNDPKVQWGFYGQDGTQQSYGGETYIGTYCGNALGAGQCQPESQINLMFIR